MKNFKEYMKNAKRLKKSLDFSHIHKTEKQTSTYERYGMHNYYDYVDKFIKIGGKEIF